MPKLGGLVVAKAHPVIFGAVLAVSLGILVYQIVKRKTKQKVKHSVSNRPRPSDDDNGAGNIASTEFKYYDPETKSLTDTPPKPKENNGLRKRHNTQNSSSTSTSNKNGSERLQKTRESVTKEVQTESIDDNQNINDIKILPDKNIEFALTLNEKVNDFLRNIYETDSVYSNESDETAKQSNCKPSCSSESSNSACSSWSNVSATDVDDLHKKTSRSPSICSVTSLESESFVGTVLSGDSELCRGCEVNPVNTHTLPCNHRYMCADCAMRIFRLFKRCKVCRSRIETVVVED